MKKMQLRVKKQRPISKSNIIEELDKSTQNETEIKDRVERNKKAKIWLEDVIERINNITSISL